MAETAAHDTVTGVTTNEPAPADVTGGAAQAAAPRPLRVLVADDFDVVRDLMRRMLNKLGHHVDEAEDGQEAVEALAEHRYDLLLLDLSMPRMSGIDVARWLNAHPDRADGLTIAVVSASAREERPILNELGITLLLPKPFRRQQLVDLVDSLPQTR